MLVKHDRLNAVHYFSLVHAFCPEHLPLYRTVCEVHHGKYIFVGQSSAHEIQGIHVIADVRLPVGLNIGIETLREDDESAYPAGLHVGPCQMEVVVMDDLAQLSRIQLVGKIAGSGAVVLVNDADWQIVRKTVPEEAQVEDHVDKQHSHRCEQVYRTLPDDENLPPDNIPKRFHHSLTFMITLMPGRSPST